METEELTRGTATQGVQTTILKKTKTRQNYLQVDFIETKIIKICLLSLIKYSAAQNRHKTTAEFPPRDFDPYWW